MLNFSEVNALGDICNTTWGRESTRRSPTVSIKTALAGENLTVTYTTVVTFGSEHAMSQQLPRYQDESAQITNDYMRDLKKSFKEKCGRSLKVKDDGSSDSVEVIYATSMSPRKTAYYRRVSNYIVA
jgi:hypothetical protein